MNKKLIKQFKIWLDLKNVFMFDEKGQIGHEFLKECTQDDFTTLQWILETRFIPFLEFVKEKWYNKVIEKRETMSMKAIAKEFGTSRSGLYRLLDKCKPTS